MVFAPSVLHHRLILGLLIASVACSERNADPTSPGESLKAAAGSRALKSAATLDGERDFIEVSNEVPSFGGYFLSDEGQLVVYVADSAEFGKARNAMSQRAAAGQFAHGARSRRPAVIVRKGRYSYRDLARWRDIVTQTVLGRVLAAITSDMDEQRNMVTIGLLPGTEAAARPEIEKLLTASGVPAAAVHYISQAPIRETSWPVTMLASSADTLLGGLRYYAQRASGYGACTIGFTANYSTGAVGFVSASHCSWDLWETNDSSHANTSLIIQPNINPPIGVEYYDPLGGTCPELWPCGRYRYSDASLFRVTGRPVRVGWLARPTTRVSGGGGSDTTVNSSDRYLFVVGTTSSITANSTIDHIGATTGWSYGSVIQTCFDSWVDYSLRRCMYKSNADNASGDSGGPVFYWNAMYPSTAIAAGIIYGQDANGDMIFSKWSSVNSELTSGSVSWMNILAYIEFSGSLNLTGDVDDLDQQPILNWDAVTTNIPGSTTYYIIYRKVWSAQSQSFIEQGGLGSVTNTTYTDTSVPFSIATYMGTTQPSSSDNYVVYTITPLNTGTYGTPSTVYFRQNP